MNALTHKFRRQAGLTLLELLLALSVGAVLSAGIVQIYISSKSGYLAQEELARMQESGRFALEIISEDLREAGFHGCASIRELDNFVDESHGAFHTLHHNFKFALQGIDQYDLSKKPDGIAKIENNTDIIALRNVASPPFELAQQGVNGFEIPDIADEWKPKKGEFAMISDCEKAVALQLGTVTGPDNTNPNHQIDITDAVAPVNKASAVTDWGQKSAYSFGDDAQVHQVKTHIYYIRNSSGDYGLYRSDGTVSNYDNQALVDDVVDLQMTYGIDTDDDKTANRYLNASQISGDQWHDVISVKVCLVLRSERDNLKDPGLSIKRKFADKCPVASQFLDSSDSTLFIQDGYLYREFTTTVTLRNSAT